MDNMVNEKVNNNTFDVTGYLAQVSYDIRVPMNTIIGNTELILHENVNKKVRDCVNDIRKASAQLMAITEDIGDLLRISNRTFELVSSEYKMEDMLLDIRRTIESKASSTGIKSEFIVDDKLPYRAFGDKARVTQMIMKLILNAFEFTKDGQVSCEIQNLAGKAGRFFLKVDVKDSGDGILSTDMVRIMGGKAVDTDEGSGFIDATVTRVFLAKTLAEQMGGRLMAKSVRGVGNIFSMLIPMRAVGDVSIREHEEETHFDSAKSVPFTASSARVLIVNSDKERAHTFRTKLSGYQIDADISLCVECARELIKRLNYDLVIHDCLTGADLSDLLMSISSYKESMQERTEYFDNLKVVDFHSVFDSECGSDELSDLIHMSLPQEKIVHLTECKYEGRGLEALEEMGLNTRMALENFNGDEDEYRNVLLTLCRSSDTKGRMLNYYLEQHDYKNYIIAMHGILGVAKVIGAEWLIDKTHELEKAAKQGLKELIEAETPSLADSFDNLLTSIRSAIDSKTNSAIKGAIDREDLISIIYELKGYLEEYKIDEIEELFYTLAQFSYPDTRVMENIHVAEEHMLNYDYNEVINSLDAILELLGATATTSI